MKWIVLGEYNARRCRFSPGGHIAHGNARAVEQGSQDFIPENNKRSLEEAEAKAKAKKEITKCLDILNGALHDSDFLIGQGDCLADTHLWSFVSYICILGVSLNGTPTSRLGRRGLEIGLP